MPENYSRDDRATSTPPKTSGNTFGQRKDDIYKRLQCSTAQCRMKYNGRKELAAENDEIVAELCEALEDTVTYGLRQQHAASVTAASLFQNMHEIVTGNIGGSSSNDTTFWDFCQLHLTAHERERYLNLKHVWTKCGRGRAFIRATLNEHSLQRYLLTWLSVEDQLQRYYSPWSLLMDTEINQELSKIVGSLNDVLFALSVDSLELNANTRSTVAGSAILRKEEPVIFAPTPIPVTTVKSKRRGNTVERPIATANSTEDLLTTLREVSQTEVQQSNLSLLVASAMEELAIDTDENLLQPPPDPIEPELEFLKEPLPDFFFENQSNQQITYGNVAAAVHDNTALTAFEADDKSETSSQYSKSSSAISVSHANCTSNNAVLEEKLRDMSERCALLETRVAQLCLENRQLVRRLTQHFHESGIDPSSSLTANFLITIPNVKLLKSKGGGSYYSYEVHITMRQHLEHWLLHRRYRDFYKLHKSLLKTHPSVAVVEFPPKKHFGNMNLVFVEERRQQLQIYLLNLVEMLPQVEACKSKSELQKAFPFFRER